MTTAQAPTAVGEIPPELLRSVPRDVAFTGAGISFIRLTITMLIGTLAMGLMFYFFMAAPKAARAKLLKAEGVMTEGRVVSLGRRLRGGDRTVHYSFMHEGREYPGSAVLSLWQWRRLPVGTQVTVRYLPADPSQSNLAGYDSSIVPLLAIPVLALLLLVTITVFVVARKQRRLLATGRAATGRVIRARPFKPRNGAPGSRVEYEFADLSGALHTGRGAMAKELPPGDALVVVVYDPDDPKKNAPYPFPLARTDP